MILLPAQAKTRRATVGKRLKCKDYKASAALLSRPDLQDIELVAHQFRYPILLIGGGGALIEKMLISKNGESRTEKKRVPMLMAKTSAINLFSQADLLRVLSDSAFLKQAIGLRDCIKTAPRPLSEASNSISKGIEKSGRARVGGSHGVFEGIESVLSCRTIRNHLSW